MPSASAAIGQDAPLEIDALVVGAGPVGLYLVFQLGLLDIKAHVVDSLPHPGGQCIELYPDKPIYDIPAVPATTGRELTASLLKQIEPFGAIFHLDQEVTSVAQRQDGRFAVETSTGLRFLCKTILIAAGVGAFQPRALRLDGIEKFRGSQLFYSVSQPADFAGKNLVVVGGDEAAIDCALAFAQEGTHQAANVTLLHRRDSLQATPAKLRQIEALCEASAMRFIVGQVTGFEAQDGRLTGVQVTDPEAKTQFLPLDGLLVFLGLSPKLGPMANWGLAMERKQLTVDTETFSTSVPGIFAVGDINTYPGKKKLIVCGFHECVLAAFAAAALIFPGQKIQLQYTTTSPRLHQLLGLQTPTQS
jgi:thioredoxin reductase (NADPH)